jgi:hypothetical protein
MTDNISEDAVSVTGNVFTRNMRKVLIEQGFKGEALETKVQELMQKDIRRVANIILAPRHER